MTDIYALLLMCTAVSSTVPTGPLMCRKCTGAKSLEDCHVNIPCPSGEICYMDTLITDQLTLEYDGGCRPRDVCSSAMGHIVGKRRGGVLVSCSRCCDADATPECNTELCGVHNSTRSKTFCNHCVTYGSRSQWPAPDKPCTDVVMCPRDQICGAESYTLSQERTNLYECVPKQRCVTETLEALRRKDACSHDPAQCIHVTTTPASNAAVPGYTKCHACCGDDQCNWRTCEQTIDYLYALWKAAVLDTTTLKQNGSLPSTFG